MSKREASRFIIRILRSMYRDHRTELAELRRHIRSGDVVCDIGANKGSFLYWLARWATPGKVIAFEPQPDLAGDLSRLCSRFSLTNVTVERSAVYLSTERRELFIPRPHQPAASLLKPAGAVDAISTSTVSLEDYFPPADHVSAIKIDEGAELDLLQGARLTIARCMPLLVFECDRRNASLERMQATFSFLMGLGYRGHFVSKGGLLPLSEFDVDVH